MLLNMGENEEDYVEWGTVLDPLDEDTTPRKKPYLENQIVRDSHGRRRFHGAFSGGFSAGFFNTVGSLEGWTPSSFCSSRSERADKKTQNPEDFMDDEDMSEFGIAPRVLRPTDDFSDKTRKRKQENIMQVVGPIPGTPPLRELLQPTRETVGIKLLCRMGWKPGQGIGPRLTRREKKNLKEERIKRSKRAAHMSPSSSICSDSDLSDDEYTKNLKFAPDDFEPLLCKPQTTSFGIGYVGLDKRRVLSTHVNLFQPSLVITEKKKKGCITGQAFGVGALEEEDEDIYAQEDMSQYDFSLENVSVLPQPSFSSHSGEIAESFTLATKPVSKKKFFPAPVLPSDFQPLHILKLDIESDIISKELCHQYDILTASDRALILQNQSDECVIEQDVSKKTVMPSTGEGAKLSENTKRVVPVPGTLQEKQNEQCVPLHNKEQKVLQPKSMTEWGKNEERSKLQQVLHLSESNTFVPAKYLDDVGCPVNAVDKHSDVAPEIKAAAKMKMYGHLTRSKLPWQPSNLLCKRFNITEPVNIGKTSIKQELQSSASVFGYLAASTHNTCRSDKLVPKTSETQIEAVPELIKTDQVLNQEHADHDMDITLLDPPERADLYRSIFLSSSEDSDSDNEEDLASSNVHITTVQTEMPHRDMNAAGDNQISENSDKSARSIESNLCENPSSSTIRAKRVLGNVSPSHGVFANLDLDALCGRKPVPLQQPKCPDETCSSVPESGKEELCTQEEDKVYGPKLPSTLFMRTLTSTATSMTRSGNGSTVQYQEMDRIKKASHKNKHKKKSSKHKKHKSKKHKRHK